MQLPDSLREQVPDSTAKAISSIEILLKDWLKAGMKTEIAADIVHLLRIHVEAILIPADTLQLTREQKRQEILDWLEMLDHSLIENLPPVLEKIPYVTRTFEELLPPKHE